MRLAYARLKAARQERTIVRRVVGNGYAHEAIEVGRCVREGAKESPIMPLSESLAILEVVDEARAQIAR